MAKILLIEDDANLRESLTDILTDKGLEITQAEDGARGVETLKDNPFDIIITDLRTPTMDSITLLDNLQSLSKGAKIIVMTAHATRLSLDKSSRIDVAAYIEKPFSPHYLLVLIDNLLKK